MFTDQAPNTERGKGNYCAGPVLPSTSQVNFVSRALLTNGKKQTKRNSPVRKLAEPSRQVRETWHRHAAARPGRARVAGEGSKLRATPRLPSSGAPRGGGRTPRRASSGRAARGPGPPPPCRSRRRGAPVPLFPLKAKAAEGPARQPPDRRPAAARLDTRLGEARQGGSARAPPTPARLEPARAPGRGPGGGLAAAALTQVRRLSPSSTLSRLSTLNMAGRGRRG